MRGFGLTHNPVALIASLRPSRATPERVLTIHELRALWRRLSDLDTSAGAILRFYLLTGGQRLAQLLRVRNESLLDTGVMLYDPKGRRIEPRPHLVPIIEPARDALEAIPGSRPYVLALKPGGEAPHPTTLFRHLQSVSRQLEREGRVRVGINFAALRRTVETRLAGEGVPAIVRAHLQSHGLDGIQTRHYDRHTYLDEKRDALQELHALMSAGD